MSEKTISKTTTQALDSIQLAEEFRYIKTLNAFRSKIAGSSPADIRHTLEWKTEDLIDAVHRIQFVREALKAACFYLEDKESPVEEWAGYCQRITDIFIQGFSTSQSTSPMSNLIDMCEKGQRAAVIRDVFPALADIIRQECVLRAEAEQKEDAE